MSRIKISILLSTHQYSLTTTYDAELPNSIVLQAPRSMFHPDIHSVQFSIQELTPTASKITKHPCLAHLDEISFQTTTHQDKCFVHRIFSTGEGSVIETYVVVRQEKHGGFELTQGELGMVGRIAGYTKEDSKRDEFLALVTGAFVLDLAHLEAEEREDAEAIVELTDGDDFDFVEHEVEEGAWERAFGV